MPLRTLGRESGERAHKMSLRGQRCLVLNGSWFPIGIENAQKSISRVFCDKADIVSQVEGTYRLFSFEQWIALPPQADAMMIHTRHCSFMLPEVIQKPYNRLHIQKLPLNANNLFVRDGYKCWYCGSEEKLTIDHIIPKCRGGKSGWKNLITCCQRCNNEKGDMSVEKFCAIRGCEIPQPINVGCFPWLKELGKRYPSSWKKWLNFV